MKKTILMIIIFAFIPLNVYAVNNQEYINTHFMEIKEYYPDYDIFIGNKILKDNSLEDEAEKLKKIYGSIDLYSCFYSKDELSNNIFVYKDIIETKTVEYKIINAVAYIRILTFAEGTYEKVLKASHIMDENEIRHLILDLRNNKGGEIAESIEIAKLFVKEGLIAKINYYSVELKDEEYYSNLKDLQYKVIVLINSETSSAAELLAGAIQDSKSGVLIGQQTFGKSRVQKLIPIMTEDAFLNINKDSKEPTVNLIKASGSGVIWENQYLSGWAKITVGKFYTKNGYDIEGNGITPDYIINDKLSFLPVEALLFLIIPFYCGSLFIS